MRRVTSTDVARHAAVSRITVSRVLNNRGQVTNEVRDRVLQAARELGYVQAKARRRDLDTGSSPLVYRAIGDIGFFYGSLLPTVAVSANPFWSPILQGAEREARRSMSHVIYRSLTTEADPAAVLETTVQRMNLGGILLVGSVDLPLLERAMRLEVPLVLVDMCFPETDCDCVLVDNERGIELAVRHLAAHRHRRIAYIGGPVGFTPASYPRAASRIFSLQTRLQSYFQSLLQTDIPIRYNLIRTGELSFDGGYQAANALLDAGEEFSAVLGANDETAIGAMKALQERGLRVPQDVSVIGFDDIESARLVTPSLTTVGVRKESIGAVAVRTLISRILEPATNTTTTLLNVRLIERQSVARGS